MKIRQPKERAPDPETVGSKAHQINKIATLLIRYRIVLIFSLALVLRVIHILCIKHNYPFYDTLGKGMDQHTYYNWAVRIINGDWLSASERIFYYSPLYAYFLAVIFKLFGAHYWIIYLIQALIDSLSAVIIAQIGERLFGKTAALLSGVVAAVCASFIFYVGLLLMESLIVFLLMFFLLLFLMALERPQRWWPWMGAGAVLALATIGRGNSLLLFPLSLVFLLYKAIRTTQLRRYFFRAIALCLISFLLVIFPVTLHNLIFGGKLVLTTSNGPILLFIGNVHDNYVGSLAYTNAYREVQQKYAGQEEIPWLKELFIDIKRHPLAFMRNLVKKTFLFINGYDIPDNVNFYLSRPLLPLLRHNPIHYHLVVPFGVLGLLLALFKRLNSEKVLIVAGFLFFFATSIIAIFVVGRYRLPFLGAVIPFFAFFILETYSFIFNRRFLRIIVLLTCGVVLYTALGISPKNPIRYTDYHIIADAYRMQNNYRLAEQYFKASLTTNPAFLDPMIQLLELYRVQNRIIDGEDVIEFALQHNRNKEGILILAVTFFQNVGDQERAYYYYTMLQNLPSRQSP